MKAKRSAQTPVNDADVVITDGDLSVHMTAPGTYLVMDMVRRVTETVEVGVGGDRRVLTTEPLKLPGWPATPKEVPNAAPFELQELRIGELLHPDRTSWPEGTCVDITPGGIVLTVVLDTPRAKEVERMQLGRFSMRLLMGRHTMMFLAKIGDSPWVDAPFSVHRIPVEYRACPPDPGEGYGWMATVVMVDACTGVVRGLRQLALSHHFSCTVLREFEKQAAIPSDDSAHAREVTRFQRQSPAALAADAPYRFEQ